MNRRIFLAILLTALICLCGCRLAKDQADTPEDILVGILVTDEYLDLFDFDGYFEDNANRILSGGEISAADSAKYEGRLWATPVDGDASAYDFGGVNGQALMSLNLVDTATGDPYRSFFSDDAFTTNSCAIVDGDDEYSVELSATMYIATAAGKRVTAYLNPVYQTADGGIYATTGQGILFDADVGGAWGQTMEETSTITEGSNTRTRRMKVGLSLECISAPVGVRIVEMSAESDVLSNTEYPCAGFPEQLESDAAYIIVETIHEDGSVTRGLYDREDDLISTLAPREDGFCAQKNCEMEWK